jgi:hypothetical protein
MPVDADHRLSAETGIPPHRLMHKKMAHERSLQPTLELAGLGGVEGPQLL